MVGEIILLIFGIVFIVVLCAFLGKPQKREMTATERVAYEDERGRMIAREETRRRY